jgi:hypothetical protein
VVVENAEIKTGLIMTLTFVPLHRTTTAIIIIIIIITRGYCTTSIGHEIFLDLFMFCFFDVYRFKDYCGVIIPKDSRPHAVIYCTYVVLFPAS